MVRIRVLGPFEVEVEGGPAELPPSRRARALLAWLALHPGRHARSKVAATFWPDVLDSSARTSLRGAVAELRRSLGPAASVLVAARETIELAGPPATWVDAQEFGRLIAEGELRGALDLVRGPVLADIDDEWVDPFRDDHQRTMLQVLDELTRRAAAAGALAEAIRFTRRRMQLDPLSEPAGRELVRLLARSGDRAGALDAAAALTERLHRELGLGPDPKTVQLIAQIRSQTAAEHTAAASGAALPAPPPIGRPQAVLVGRDDVLDRIDQVRRHAAGQGGSVVLISGDPGIGKTSLAIAAARLAALEGLTTLYGRCDEEGIVPFEPWVEAIGHALDHLESERVAGLARDSGPALARLFPQLRQHLPAAIRPSQAEPDTERWRLFDAVSALLHELCRPPGLVLVLDDVHWADRSTLLLLRHVLRTRRSAPITVLMTSRTADLAADSYLHDVLAELRRAELLTVIELGGLDEPEVGELVARRRGAPAEREFVRALHQETEGNPFFVEEILRSVPKPSTVDHSSPADGGFGVPQGVHDLLRRRLSQLPKEVNDVLVQAAVLGRDFDLIKLGRLSGFDDEVLIDTLDQAIGASVIDETGIGRYSFSHALFRSALYDSLTRTRRARLHLMVAQAIESLAGGGSSEAAEIAHHYLAAAQPEFLGPAL
ncbi:MAG TPA: AAA family ATPase, partial [Jiangellaceae bacterium]|nr:AAA family ATPase [Jiangellaceae bacterium]